MLKLKNVINAGLFLGFCAGLIFCTNSFASSANVVNEEVSAAFEFETEKPVSSVPNEAPQVEKPELIIEESVPNDAPVLDKPELKVEEPSTPNLPNGGGREVPTPRRNTLDPKHGPGVERKEEETIEELEIKKEIAEVPEAPVESVNKKVLAPKTGVNPKTLIKSIVIGTIISIIVLLFLANRKK